MALPPDTAESFAREVDENLRLDQQRDFFKKHGATIVAAMGLLLAAAGGWIYWENHQQKVASEESETLSSALDKVGAGSPEAAAADLAALSESSVDTTRAAALLTRAAIAQRKNDTKTAIALYQQIADDGGLPQPYRDLATVRLVAVQFDQMKPDDVIARLATLAQPGKPFFGTAGEMTAAAMMAKGDKAGAGQLFAKIAADNQAPQSIRTRAAQIAESLGVDASASIPASSNNNPAL